MRDSIAMRTCNDASLNAAEATSHGAGRLILVSPLQASCALPCGQHRKRGTSWTSHRYRKYGQSYLATAHNYSYWQPRCNAQRWPIPTVTGSHGIL